MVTLMKGYTDKLRDILSDGPKTLTQIREEWEGEETENLYILLYQANDINYLSFNNENLYYLEGDEDKARELYDQMKSEKTSDEHVPDSKILSKKLKKYGIERTDEVEERFTEFFDQYKEDREIKKIRSDKLPEIVEAICMLIKKEQGKVVTNLQKSKEYKDLFKLIGVKSFTKPSRYSEFFLAHLKEKGEIREENIEKISKITNKVANYIEDEYPVIYQGKSVIAFSASIVYVVLNKLENTKSPSQSTLASIANVTTPTIRNNAETVEKVISDMGGLQ